MNVIYYCYGSAHSSIISAHIHLGHLPVNRVPTDKEILSLPDFDSSQEVFIGSLYFKGIDDLGNKIYTLGTGKEPEIAKNSFISMIKLSGGDPEQYIFFSALPQINQIAKFGGALSRRYGLIGIGRKITVLGIIQSYNKLVHFVEECRLSLEEHRNVSFKK